MVNKISMEDIKTNIFDRLGKHRSNRFSRNNNYKKIDENIESLSIFRVVFSRENPLEISNYAYLRIKSQRDLVLESCFR